MVFFYSRDLLISIIEKRELTTRFWKSSLIRRLSPFPGHFVQIEFYHQSNLYVLKLFQIDGERCVVTLRLALSTGATGMGFMPVWNSILFLYHNMTLAYGADFSVNKFVVIHVLLNYLYPYARLGLLQVITLTSIEVLGNAAVVDGQIIMNPFIIDVLRSFIQVPECEISTSLGTYISTLQPGQAIAGSEVVLEFVAYLAVLQEGTPRADLNGFVTLSIPGEETQVVKQELPAVPADILTFYTDAYPILGPNKGFQAPMFNAPSVQDDMLKDVRDKRAAKAIAKAQAPVPVGETPKPTGGKRGRKSNNSIVPNKDSSVITQDTYQLLLDRIAALEGQKKVTDSG